MTFTKPENLKYTDMCIYIDNHIYTDDCDHDLVYQYLYLLIFMLARKNAIFSKYKYYDGFALFGATRVYFRLINKKQFELCDDGESYRMDRIKSILNYLKNILYHLKVDYEQSEYCQSISKESSLEDFDYNFNNLLRSSLSGIYLVDFKATLHDVPRTCRHFLKGIPYPEYSSEWLNIYVSVMLTFLNSITLRKKYHQRIQHLRGTNRIKDEHVVSFFKDEMEEEPILFHLPSHMSSYILVLSRQLRMVVAKDLAEILDMNFSQGIEMANMIASNFFVEQEELDED